MSTVLLMTDTWQPTVLRLVPFSSNNARVPDKKGIGKGTMNSRNFPVLAVTRSSATSDIRSDAKSANSYRSEIADDMSVFSEANGSEVTTKTARTERSSGTYRRTKYAKKKVPEMHSEMKEAIKFSVQDLNDQLSSSSSLQSCDNKDESSDKYNKLDNTRTKLPKPSMCTSPEGRFCSPVNGVRRSVPLTPGEMELQRVRDSYFMEQVQKRKKYKLNINQLPRSTTPINDHDPDKLNMKQVIAFLQTKTSKDIQKKILSEKKGHLSTANSRSQSRGKVYDDSPSSPKRVQSKDNGKGFSRSDMDARHEDQLEPDNTRLNAGCVSVMSTKSTPNFGTKSTKEAKSTATHSVKSFKDRSKDRKSSKPRPMKEFKLYRFLTVASEGRSEGLATTFTDAVPMVEPSVLRTESRVQESPRKLLHRRNRESGTAQVLHRHASSRSTITSTPPKTETNQGAEEQNKAIRLPIMSDADNEAADADSESCSTTSATCNSTKYISTKEDHFKHPKKGKSITFDENIDVNISVKGTENSPHSEYSESSHRTHKVPGFPRVNISGPRHIHVSLPQEDKKNYSQEIVRLTLRQEKNATRVTSYMSDIQQNPSTPWHEQCIDGNEDSNSDHGNSLPANLNACHGSRQLLENTKYLNNITNNSFIKVRQKLRATNMYNSE